MKGGPGSGDPGQLTWTNLGMRTILLRAYGIQNYQLTAPKWVDDARFDIAAKIPAGATSEQFRAMLRNLLKERFKLEAREEVKEMPIYALLVAKGGSKLKESTQTAPPETPVTAPEPGRRVHLENGFPPLPPGPGMTALILNGNWRLSAQAQTPAQLTEFLSTQLDRGVVDQTELKGLYDFHLSFMPENMLARMPVGGEPRPDAPVDLFTALGQQLGLRLEPRKGPVKILLVDAMEKTPTEN